MKDILRERILEAFPDLSEGPSRFEKDVHAFKRGRKEVAHFHADEEIDIRVGRKHVRTLKDDPHAVHRQGTSDWVAYRLEDEGCLERALELVRVAYEAAS